MTPVAPFFSQILSPGRSKSISGGSRSPLVYPVLVTVSLLSTLALIQPAAVRAVCPVCTVAIVAGVGVSRWLGIDDTASGVWFGGLLVSSGLWLANWLRRKKNLTWWWLDLAAVIGFWLLTVLPLYFTEIVGHPLNKLWGIDKLLLGMLVGTAGFGLSVGLDKALRARNAGKVFVPFQKVILPVSILLITSLVFYFITLK